MTDGSTSMEQRVRAIVADHGGLGATAGPLEADVDLYAAGMSSRASVSVMLALEAAFELEFPDSMLRREVFATIGAICSALDEIRAGT